MIVQSSVRDRSVKSTAPGDSVGGQARALLAEMFDAAVKAADPRAAIRAHLPDRPPGRTIVAAFGKGAASMAAAFEAAWDGPIEGMIVDRHGSPPASSSLIHYRAAHPTPDAAGLSAAEAMLRLVQGATARDLVVVLASGGGSALLPAPAPGLTLEDEVQVNRLLLASGLPIRDMNLIRSHLSRIKGGGLAAAARPARVVTFVVSDVPGDDPGLVSSGPSIRLGRSAGEALDIVLRHGLELPPRAAAYLKRLAAGEIPPLDRADGDEVHLAASAALSLEAAAATGRSFGYEACILSDRIEGEAASVGRMHAAIARHCRLAGQPFRPPLVMLSGGETTVRLEGQPGRGGRNTEFLLAFAADIDGVSGIHALAADTDGIDGSENNAGAYADGGSAERMRRAGLNLQDLLRRHDAYSGFAAASDLFVTGQTGTNVNDFRAVLIAGPDDAT